MAPSAALIIACAALAAVILQASLSHTPDNFSLGSSSRLSAGAPAAAGSSAIANLVPHESRDDVPHGWANLGAAADSTPMTLRVALHSKNVAGLQQALLAVSTPGNSRYGQHLNAAQVKTYMAPSAQSVKTVTDHFASQGVSLQPMAGHGDWMSFDTTVAQAGRLFNASFSTYHHVDSGTTRVRTLAYSVPAHLKEHIELVHPMTTFAPPHARQPAARDPKPLSRRWSSRQSIDSSCDKEITPACLQQVYGLPADPAMSSGNSIIVNGYNAQFAQEADMQAFLQKFRPDMDPTTTWDLQTADGGSDPQNATQAANDDEANLDIQYTVGVANGVPITFFQSGGHGIDGFIDSVNFVASQTPLPTVMTTSYSFNEEAVSPPLAQKLCNAYAALGAQGVSLMFSSGDHGVAAHTTGACTVFHATFPSSCPYVTSVGATKNVPEVGMFDESIQFSPTGGFSNYFPAPDYQSAVVGDYISALGDTYSGLYNASGRGFPDVSAYGQDVAIFLGGKKVLMDGTSAATPIFASVVALLNDQLLAAGKSPLGFLNPWLYANPGVLTDIVDGNNPGCDTDGFSAGTGWDPLTGLGTPKFAAMLTAAGLGSS